MWKFHLCSDNRLSDHTVNATVMTYHKLHHTPFCNISADRKSQISGNILWSFSVADKETGFAVLLSHMVSHFII